MRVSLRCHVEPWLSEFWCLNKFPLLHCQLRSWRWMEELVTFNLTLWTFHTLKPLPSPNKHQHYPKPKSPIWLRAERTPASPPNHLSQRGIRGLAWSESKFKFGTAGLNHNLHLLNYSSLKITGITILVILMDIHSSKPHIPTWTNTPKNIKQVRTTTLENWERMQPLAFDP